jgi:hypothetical protein
MASVVIEALMTIAKHWEIVELVIDLAENKAVAKERIVQALKDGIWEAADIEMRKEFPNG